MRIPDYPHTSMKPMVSSVKPTVRAAILDEPERRLDFLKSQVAFLEENLTSDEKSDKLIAAKLEALTQKISQLENLVNQMSDACMKGDEEVIALLNSFKPIEHD